MDLLKQWQESMESKKKSPNTIEGYIRELSIFFNWIKQFKQVEEVNVKVIKSITSQDLEKFMTFLMEERECSSATMIHYGQSIRSFYLWLRKTMKLISIEEEYIAKDLELPKKQKRIAKSLSEEELELLINTIHSSQFLRDRAIVTLMVNTGLRIQELVDINIEDIVDDSIRIIGKGDKEREVVLNQKCKDALEKYLEVRPDVGTNALFINERKVRITTDGTREVIKKMGRDIGNNKVTPHIFRKTFATLMLEKGVDIRTIQEMLGHDNISTTEIYLSVSKKTKKEAVEKLDKNILV